MDCFLDLEIQDNEESFYISKYDENGHLDREMINFGSNRLGYILCLVLDLDIALVLDLIHQYDEINDRDRRIEKMIGDGSYNSLLEISELYKLYPVYELNNMIHDHIVDDANLVYFLERLHAFVNYFDNKQMQYDLGFFSYLYENDYFGRFIEIEHSDAPTKAYRNFMPKIHSAEEINDIDTHYTRYIASTPIWNANAKRKYSIYDGNRIARIALITIKELTVRKKIVRKCANCGKHFIAEHRIDTLYCDNPSHQDQTMSCKKYATQRLWYEKQQEDEIAKLSRNILATKQMRAKRNPDYQKFQNEYDTFRKDRLEWKKAVAEGTKTREEYHEWLLTNK